MATFKKLPSGNWRVQVRRKGCHLSETFRRHVDAEEWAIAAERRIDRGETPKKRTHADPTTFGHLIDDLKEVGKAPRRSKAFTLDALQSKLGLIKIGDLTRERLIQFGKDRAKEGAGGVTVGMDIGYIKLVISHAAAVHGIEVSPASRSRGWAWPARAACATGDLSRASLSNRSIQRPDSPDPICIILFPAERLFAPLM